MQQRPKDQLEVGSCQDYLSPQSTIQSLVNVADRNFFVFFDISQSADTDIAMKMDICFDVSMQGFVLDKC